MAGYLNLQNNPQQDMATTNNKQLVRLKGLLKDLFQLDQPELDFGLYKIMHAKSVQITRFLENDLLKEIETAFGARDSANAEQLFAQAKAKLFESLGDTALDANGELHPTFAALPAGKKFLEDMANAQATRESLSADAEIYDHLYRFFERYYDNGDFLSRRYYARESDTRAAPYSVPYDGREVYLHWANKDQYYIKSGENFTHYTFDLIEAVKKHLDGAKTNGQDGAFDFEVPTTATGEQKAMKVHLRIAEAQEGEHGNIKASGDQKREFIPLLSKPAELDADGSLVLNFEYKVMPEGYPFDEVEIKAKFGSINKEHMPSHWMADVFLQAMAQLPEGQAAEYMRLLNLLAPSDKQTKRPLLAKYISLYTARNTMDYFIHKDLGGFLRRELDFYIKNEVMRLDDIENADAPKVEQYLRKVKVLRRIADQLISFLAQLEDFQKKLWLKKKFVTEVNYCITLDRIPEKFYPEIAANEVQREEWVKLFAIDEIVGDDNVIGYNQPLSVDFLKANQFLLIDTAFFTEKFKSDVLESLMNLDSRIDGLLFHSDNYQALGFVEKKYRASIRAAYVDPPYNTGSDGFPYKDSYQHSSWMQFLMERVEIAKRLLMNDGYHFTHIDYIEASYLSLLLNSIFGRDKAFPPFNIKTATPAGFKVVNPGPVNVSEQIYCFANGPKNLNNSYVESGWQSDYSKVILNKIEPAKDWVVKSLNEICYENLNVSNKRGLEDKFGKRVAEILFNEERARYSKENANAVFATFGPHNPSKSMQDGIKKSRANPGEVVPVDREDGGFHYLINGRLMAFYSAKMKEVDGELVPTQHLSDFWSDLSWDSLSNEGGVTLKNGKKPMKLLQRVIGLSEKSKSDWFLDYFAGSGTTGNAVVELNRLDNGARKYILCEVSNYFDEILRVRMLRSSYSKVWSDGKPVGRQGVGQCFKYIRLESYEDALNNLIVSDDVARDRALDASPELRSAYMLNYWLDVETQGSPSLLNVQAFADPTNYAMKIKRPGSDALALQRIDLIETFNWLIGLWVEHLAAPQTFSAEFDREVDKDLPKDQNTRLVCKRLKQDDQGPYWFRLVEGYTLKVPGDDSSRQKTLVVWRKLTDNPEQDNAALQKFLMEKLQISPRENTYDVIYVNGSHTLPNPLVEAEQTKVRLIEEAFHAAMWSQEAI